MPSPAVALILASNALVLVVAWHLARPMPSVWRLGFLLVVGLLLAGMTLPPEAIRAVAAALHDWWPGPGDSNLVSQNSSAVAHLGLFALVSAWLCWWRADLRAWALVAMLGVLSVATEGLQLLVDGRYASILDVGLNLLGAAIGLAALWLSPRRGQSA